MTPSGGRVFVRYSGTEPKARVLVEAPDAELVDKWCTHWRSAARAGRDQGSARDVPEPRLKRPSAANGPLGECRTGPARHAA